MAELTRPPDRPFDKQARAFNLSEVPLRERQVGRRGHFGVSVEAALSVTISFRQVVSQCPFENGSRSSQVSLEKQDEAERSPGRARLGGLVRDLQLMLR